MFKLFFSGFTKIAIDSLEENFLAALEEIQDNYDTKYPIEEANKNIRKSLVKLKGKYFVKLLI